MALNPADVVAASYKPPDSGRIWLVVVGTYLSDGETLGANGILVGQSEFPMAEV